jgi:hypothetical protein
MTTIMWMRQHCKSISYAGGSVVRILLKGLGFEISSAWHGCQRFDWPSRELMLPEPLPPATS